MWRWIGLVTLAVLHTHISSQPILDNDSDDRPTTHLDIEESCSCEDLEKSTIRRDARYDDTIDADSEDVVFARTPDLDHCPCRFRETDSEGASSLLFPTAMRSAGTYLRPSEKKGELKPLFNPEVDLASSVLETLRIATDEEYKDALARDAAKSAARAVEDIVFGDPTPQESANIVTFVVKPKTKISDDVVAEASNIKQSRCIHPLQRASSFRFISDRPRLSEKSPYYKNLYDTDSEVGASSIDEQILPFEEYKDKLSDNPLIVNRNDIIQSDTPNNNVVKNCNVPDLKSTSVQNKLLELTSRPLLKSIKDKIRPLSLVPKLKLQSILPEQEKNSHDLSTASSMMQGQTERRVPYIRHNPKLESLRQTSRPLSITNLLNLKDVELIPLRDLISKQVKKSKVLKSESLLPSKNKNNDDESTSTKDLRVIHLTLRNNPMEDSVGDSKSSSSIANYVITPKSINSDDYHSESEEMNTESNNTEFNESKNVLPSIIKHVGQDPTVSETKCFSELNDLNTDNIDTETSPSLENIKISSKKMQMTNNGYDNVGVMKNFNDENYESRPITTDILDTIPVVKDEVPKAIVDNDNSCDEDENTDQDLMRDSSNSVSSTIDQTETRLFENQNVESDKASIKEPRLKLLSPNTIDKTISDIKKYIQSKQVDLNNIKTSIKNRNMLNTESENTSVSRYENEDCANDTTISPKSEELDDNIAVVTSTKPDLIDSSSEDDCVQAKNNDQDSSTEASNTVSNTIAQLENRLFENENIESNKAKAIKESRLNLLHPNTINKTLSNIKNYILMKQEDLNNIKTSINSRNMPNQENKDVSALRNVNENGESDSSIRMISPKSEVNDDNLEVLPSSTTHLADRSFKDICVEDKKNEQDSLTDASSIVSSTIDQQETRSFQNKEVEFEEPKNIKEYDKPNTIKESRLNLLDTNTINKTISNIKNYILKKQEDLNNIKTSRNNRNMYNQENKVNEDYDNDASMQIITPKSQSSAKLKLVKGSVENTSTISKPNINSEDAEITCVSDAISMQDLQKMSDSMLKREEGESTNVKNKPLDVEKVETLIEKSEASDCLDLDSFANTETETIMEPENLENVRGKLETINDCETDLPVQTDVDGQASEIFSVQSPLKETVGLLKNPLKDISNILKQPPLDPLRIIDNVNAKFTNLFDKNERDANTFLILPKTTGARESKFPLGTSLLKFSDALDFDTFETTLKPSLFTKNNKFNQSKPKLLLGGKSNPINLNAAYDKESYPTSTDNLNNPLNDLGSQLIDSSVQATNNIYSSLKNTHSAVESKLRQLKKNNRQAPSLFDTLSQNHEDINNKLRALHMDFNDRVETMRNGILDDSKLLTSVYRGINPKLKPSSVFNKKGQDNINDKFRALHTSFNDKIESMRNDIIDKSKLLSSGSQPVKTHLKSSNSNTKQNKYNLPSKKTWQASNRKEPILLSSNKKVPLKTNFLPKILDQKKLRMPAAASVSVPRTIQVPELKTTSAKLPPSFRAGSSLTPNTNRKDNEGVSRNYVGHASNLQLPMTLRNTINRKKENKINISFSTTTRPEVLNEYNFRSSKPQNIPKNRVRFESRPNEVKKAKLSISNYGQPNKYSKIETDDDFLSKSSRFIEKGDQKVSKTALQSWPKATESAFLSKVKDALRDRLSKVSSSKSLKQPNAQVNKAKMRDLKSDMARSASENKEIINGQTLQENVPYKCKMVCTKE